MATLQRMFAAAASTAAPAYFLGTRLVHAQDATKAAEAADAAPIAGPARDAKEPPTSCPVHKATEKHAPEPPSACPMHNSGVPPSGTASNGSSQRGAASRSSEGCPVMHGTREQTKENDTEEVLNMDNMMPAPNQVPAPGQKAALSTDRVVSTIPRGGDAGTWMYPSEQMFYNALLRKGKGEGVQEKDMNSVVAIHNNMNERGWMQVLEWESLHCDECKAPKLLRFVGRPDDLSPKARLKVMFGLAPRPFDRHDWTIDRCGKEVRYIIDYYDLEHKQKEDRKPELHDMDSVPSIEMDVRPALDSAEAAFDRLRMLLRQGAAPQPASEPTPAADTDKEPAAVLASDARGAGAADAADAAYAAAAADALADEPTHVFGNCSQMIEALQSCEGDKECAQAHIGLTLCIAEQVCQDKAAAFLALRGSSDAEATGAAYDAVQTCVTDWSQRSREAGSH